MIRRSALGAFICLFGAEVTAAPVSTPLTVLMDNLDRGGEIVPGEVLIRTARDRSWVLQQAVKMGCALDHQFGHHPLFLLQCQEGRPMPELIEVWQNVEGIEWVEASFYEDNLEAIPNDLVNLQWYHENIGQQIDNVGGVPNADMRSPEAWDIVSGNPARKIAIIDIGVYPDHLDLMNNIWVNPGENCTNGQDDDNNGYIDDCHGWDIGEDDNDPTPLTLPETRTDGTSCLRWHATFIAGLAAAQGNNNFGITGTAWNVSLINIKRHASSCRSTSSRNTEATHYAIDNGADAIGMSFSSTTDSTTFEQALQRADLMGVIVVMSAGNGNYNIDSRTRYPNNYNFNNKIIVTSTDNRDLLDPTVNYGPNKIHLAAPGTYVVSTSIDDNQAYGVGTGTSMSVGFVLGAVALAKQAYPQLSATQVRDSILQGGKYLSNLDCNLATRCISNPRRLDLFGMLEHANGLYPANLQLDSLNLEEVGNGNNDLEPGESANLLMNVRNSGTGPAHVTTAALTLQSSSPHVIITRGQTNIGTIDPQGSTQPAGVSSPAFYLSPSCTGAFTASFQLTLADRFGNDWPSSFTVDIDCGTAPPPPDAGFLDSGVLPDSGLHPDALIAQPDATTNTDAFVQPDAGTHDSGVPGFDSGTTVDTGGVVHPDANNTWNPVGTSRSRSGGCRTTTNSGVFAPWLALLFLLLLEKRRFHR